MKKGFRNVAVAALLIALAGWFVWFSGVIGPGEHGEHWEQWDRAIKIIWVIIPAGFGISLLSSIGWGLTPPRTPNSTGCAVALILCAIAFVAWVVSVVTHLGIS